MKIHRIDVQDLHASGFRCDCEGVAHQKVLSTFSIVQSVEGSYDIAIDNSSVYATGPMGIFVAPPGKTQKILHHNGPDQVMEAQWIYFNAKINDLYPLENLIACPVILSESCRQTVYDAIYRARASGRIGHLYAAAYEMIDLLLQESRETPIQDPQMIQLQSYIAQHFQHPIKAEHLAEMLHCSIAQVYRYTQKFFHCSPANYINRIRLQNAAKLLEISSLTIQEIAYRCGFEDQQYFSRQFRGLYSLPPGEYRKSLQSPKRS